MYQHAYFIALELPDNICCELDNLAGDLAGINWCQSDQYHITLAYLGPVDIEQLDDLVFALRMIKHKRIPISLSSVNLYPKAQEPRAIATEVNQSDSLASLRKKINQAAIRSGLVRPRKRFHPHVTIGRFSPDERALAHPELLADYLSSRGLFSTEQFDVSTYILYSSRRTDNGTEYEPLEQFKLV